MRAPCSRSPRSIRSGSTLPTQGHYPDLAAAIRAALTHLDAAAEILRGITHRPRFSLGDRVDVLDDDGQVQARGWVAIAVEDDRVLLGDDTGDDDWAPEFTVRPAR